MQDMIPKGTGNSRKLKSSLAAGTTWEQALAQLRAGTFPIDLAGVNAAGVQQMGDALNKANLLSDQTAAKLWPAGQVPENPVVDGALGRLGGAAFPHIEGHEPIHPKIPLNTLLGAEVYINVSYTVWPFLVAQINYEGSGRIALLSRECGYATYGESAIYAGSAIDAECNSFYESLDQYAKGLIDNVSIKVTASDSSVTTIQRKCFIPSATEFGGVSPSYVGVPYNIEGTEFSRHDSFAPNTAYLTRTPSNTNTSLNIHYYNVWQASMKASGPLTYTITLPSNTEVILRNGKYVLSPQEYTPYNLTLINAMGKPLPSQGTRIETGSYVGTGGYGEENPNSLTMPDGAFALLFLGSSSVNGVYPLTGYRDGFLIPLTILRDSEPVSYEQKAGSSSTALKVQKTSSVLKWHCRSNAADQLNGSGTYHYAWLIGG